MAAIDGFRPRSIVDSWFAALASSIHNDLTLVARARLLSLVDSFGRIHFNNFFHLGPGGALYLIGLNGVGIWLLFHLIKILPDNKFNQLLCWCSVRVTSLYVLQWTLVCWGMGVIGFKTLSPELLMLMLPLMIVLTLTVHYLLEKGIQFSRQVIRNKMQASSCSNRLNAS